MGWDGTGRNCTAVMRGMTVRRQLPWALDSRLRYVPPVTRYFFLVRSSVWSVYVYCCSREVRPILFSSRFYLFLVVAVVFMVRRKSFNRASAFVEPLANARQDYHPAMAHVWYSR